MVMIVLVEFVVGTELVRFVGAVVVAVFVDDDGRSVVADQTTTERLGEERRHEHFAGRSVSQHATGHQHDAIGTPGLGEVMGREDHDATRALAVLDHVEDAELAREIEAGDRLVEQEHVGVGCERLGDEHALLLASRQRPERRASEVGDLELVGRPIDQLAVEGTETAEQLALAVTPHAEHLVDRERHPGVVVPVLCDEGDRASNLDVAVFGDDDPGQERQQRRLPAAVRTDERHRRPRVDRERTRCERDRGAVVDTRIVDACDHARSVRRTEQGCHENDSHSSLVRMVLKRPGVTGMCVLGAALALVGCAGGDSGEASDDGGAALIATTTVWADVTSAVACGAPIPSLIPFGADPHSFEPALRDRAVVEHATTIIANGLALEEPLLDLLATARDGGTIVLDMADHVDVITGDDEHDQDEHSADDGHGHATDGDPHIWQDPTRVAGTLDTIATAVAAAGFPVCTDDYRSELAALDEEIRAMIESIPPDARVMVTSHDSLAYFADRYGMTIVGTVIPSTSTLAETNAADLADLADAIEANDVPAIFTDDFESTADAEALAQRLGVEVVPLITGSLTDDTPTYVDMMRHNAELITNALAP